MRIKITTQLYEAVEVDGVVLPGRFFKRLADACKSGLPFQITGQGSRMTIQGLGRQ